MSVRTNPGADGIFLSTQPMLTPFRTVLEVISVERFTTKEVVNLHGPTHGFFAEPLGLNGPIDIQLCSLHISDAAGMGLFEPGDKVNFDISRVPKKPLPAEEEPEPTTAD